MTLEMECSSNWCTLPIISCRSQSLRAGPVLVLRKQQDTTVEWNCSGSGVGSGCAGIVGTAQLVGITSSSRRKSRSIMQHLCVH